MYKIIFKPFFDFIISFLLLIILSPIILAVVILLFFANKGKVFFIQERPGKNEKPFAIIKFKTMNDKKDADGNLLPDEKRLTIIGKIVRKLSFDELLQFVNVLKGDMSLIGPRPLLIEYLPLYNDFQRRRHNVKPGITGWAQVNGRNEIPFVQKVELGKEYLEKKSIWFELKIIVIEDFLFYIPK